MANFGFSFFLGGGVGLSLFVFKKKNAKHVALDEPARCEQTNRRFEYFATKQPKVALIVPTESSSQASFPIRMIIPPKKINNANAVCAGRTGLNWSSAKPPTRTMSFQVRSLWIWRPIVRLEIDLPNRSLWSSRSRGGQDASTGTGLWIMVVQFSARRGGISRSFFSWDRWFRPYLTTMFLPTYVNFYIFSVVTSATLKQLRLTPQKNASTGSCCGTPPPP